MTGEALIVMEGIDAEGRAVEESPVPGTFCTRYESDVSWIAVFAYREEATWKI
tara:strand:+ start:59 stop:217 length:159 start_codon:yes stop_codon:yes gene_type:complete